MQQGQKNTNNINGADGTTIAPYFTNMAAMAFNNPAPPIYLRVDVS
jgi:hypothetical protein